MSAAGDGKSQAAAYNGDGHRSIGQLVATATTDLHALVHDEIALMKAEVREDVKKAGIGGAALAVAAVLVFFGIPVLSFAAAYGLHALGLALGWSFLIVFGVHFLIAAAVGAFGMYKVKRVSKPERSLASARKTVAVVSSGIRPGGSHPTEGREKGSGVARSAS